MELMSYNIRTNAALDPNCPPMALLLLYPTPTTAKLNDHSLRIVLKKVSANGIFSGRRCYDTINLSECRRVQINDDGVAAKRNIQALRPLIFISDVLTRLSI
jgi:hypothetical protein